MPWIDDIPQVVGRIVGQPHLALIVFPNQRLERHVDRYGGSFLHSGSAKSGIAKHDDSPYPQGQAILLRGICVVQAGKHHPALCSTRVNSRLEALNGLVSRVGAQSGDEAVIGERWFSRKAKQRQDHKRASVAFCKPFDEVTSQSACHRAVRLSMHAYCPNAANTKEPTDQPVIIASADASRLCWQYAPLRDYGHRVAHRVAR
jgi:hypothetical protein